MIHRRTLLIGLAGLIASPAIVRAYSLMPVRAWKEPELELDDGIIVPVIPQRKSLFQLLQDQDRFLGEQEKLSYRQLMALGFQGR